MHNSKLRPATPFEILQKASSWEIRRQSQSPSTGRHPCDLVTDTHAIELDFADRGQRRLVKVLTTPSRRTKSRALSWSWKTKRWAVFAQGAVSDHEL